jgi:hypothetical protein
MLKSRFTSEQIVAIVRESEGTTGDRCSRKRGITLTTLFRRRKRLGGLDASGDIEVRNLLLWPERRLRRSRHGRFSRDRSRRRPWGRGSLQRRRQLCARQSADALCGAILRRPLYRPVRRRDNRAEHTFDYRCSVQRRSLHHLGATPTRRVRCLPSSARTDWTGPGCSHDATGVRHDGLRGTSGARSCGLDGVRASRYPFTTFPPGVWTYNTVRLYDDQPPAEPGTDTGTDTRCASTAAAERARSAGPRTSADEITRTISGGASTRGNKSASRA